MVRESLHTVRVIRVRVSVSDCTTLTATLTVMARVRQW